MKFPRGVGFPSSSLLKICIKNIACYDTYVSSLEYTNIFVLKTFKVVYTVYFTSMLFMNTVGTDYEERFYIDRFFLNKKKCKL